MWCNLFCDDFVVGIFLEYSKLKCQFHMFICQIVYVIIWHICGIYACDSLPYILVFTLLITCHFAEYFVYRKSLKGVFQVRRGK